MLTSAENGAGPTLNSPLTISKLEADDKEEEKEEEEEEDIVQPGEACYLWQSVNGTPEEKGGVATAHGASEGRVNYENAGYYTLSVNAKKANIGTDYLLITLDQPLQASDQLEITAYRNKDTDANGTLYLLFDNGHAIDEGDDVVWNNIHPDYGQQPNTNTYTVGEGAGSQSFKIARSKSGTNVFITKLAIMRSTVGIEEVEIAEHTTKGIYNLQGQRVDASSVEELPRGLYIVNGRKLVVR